MHTSLSPSALSSYVARQLTTFFPDADVSPHALMPYLDAALERVDHCFKHIRRKYYSDASGSQFDHLNTDQYAAFLYFLANTIFRNEGDPTICKKLFGLNKALHAVDVYYEVALPDIFGWQHPVGTVLGRATYADYAFFYQRCTVGGNLALEYPSLGRGVVLYGDTAVIGRASLGNNAWISVGTKVKDETIAPDTVVFGSSPSLTRKPAKRTVTSVLFGAAT